MVMGSTMFGRLAGVGVSHPISTCKPEYFLDHTSSLIHFHQLFSLSQLSRFLQSVDVKVKKLQHLMKTSAEDGGGLEMSQVMDRCCRGQRSLVVGVVRS